MVKFVEHLPAETIVLVRATVQDPHSHGQSDIHYTSIHNVEVRVKTVSFSLQYAQTHSCGAILFGTCWSRPVYSLSRFPWLTSCVSASLAIYCCRFTSYRKSHSPLHSIFTMLLDQNQISTCVDHNPHQGCAALR